MDAGAKAAAEARSEATMVNFMVSTLEGMMYLTCKERGFCNVDRQKTLRVVSLVSRCRETADGCAGDRTRTTRNPKNDDQVLRTVTSYVGSIPSRRPRDS